MHNSRIPVFRLLLFSLVLAAGVAALVSCGGSSQPTTATGGTVGTFLSDPPTCSEEFPDVYVTITKVEANLNANAGPTDSGWQTLVDLSSAPKQVDLMKLNPSADAAFCGTLFSLGQKVLPPGKYQQIRLYLLSNTPASGTATPSSNACGSSAGWNCVVTSDGTKELQLPSEVQTGIKIPSSQITNGGLTVTAGQSVDLNIEFKSCESVVQEGNGQYRLKPVLHAGEVTLNTNTISGKVVEGSNAPNPGAAVPDAVVLLEQADSNGVDRVVMSGTTQSDGTFAFCPVASDLTGNFDVVVGGSQGSSPSYNPSVVFGVPIGGGTGNIPLYAETSTVPPAGPATVSGQIQSDAAGEVMLSALQSVTNPSDSSTVNVTVPVLGAESIPSDNVTNSQPPIYTTLAAASVTGGCGSGSDCVNYTLTVPASTAAVGVYNSSSGNNVTEPSSTNSASYTVNALANGDPLLTCSPTFITSNSFTVTTDTPGNIKTGVDLALTSCTAPAP
ncbi:MAG: DUF4382 domain-containing protein [Acidobacteria bacterium]|nr:DUF4382 domain-containing protein [Acidobacteriota bacterium]